MYRTFFKPLILIIFFLFESEFENFQNKIRGSCKTLNTRGLRNPIFEKKSDFSDRNTRGLRNPIEV